MKSLFKKVRGNKKGFTLAELLVVVAIVGILVAISIPVFTAQLGKARRATNNANLRAAKAAAVAEYLTSDDNNGKSVEYKYDIAAGSVKAKETHDTGAKEVVINDTTTEKKVSSTDVYKDIWVLVDATNGAKDESNNPTNGDGTANEKVTLYAK